MKTSGMVLPTMIICLLAASTLLDYQQFFVSSASVPEPDSDSLTISESLDAPDATVPTVVISYNHVSNVRKRGQKSQSLEWHIESEDNQPWKHEEDTLEEGEEVVGPILKESVLDFNNKGFSRFPIPSAVKYLNLARRYARWSSEYRKLSQNSDIKLDSMMDEFLKHYAHLDSEKYIHEFACPISASDEPPVLDTRIVEQLPGKNVDVDFVFDIIKELIGVLEENLEKYKEKARIGDSESSDSESGDNELSDSEYTDSDSTREASNLDDVSAQEEEIERAIQRAKLVGINAMRGTIASEAKTIAQIALLYSLHIDGISAPTIMTGYLGSLKYRGVMTVLRGMTLLKPLFSMADLLALKAQEKISNFVRNRCSKKVDQSEKD